MTPGEREYLERWIDAYGLSYVVGEIANICAGKADHIRETWQDKALARRWDRAARAVERASGTVSVAMGEGT